jgi:hypothetical protein
MGALGLMTTKYTRPKGHREGVLTSYNQMDSRKKMTWSRSSFVRLRNFTTLL